ncbi:NACHT and ankyrin domain protein [Mycena chlorophos]|uniref:NACHT and ankyrin domain protein n=1 Tax=Mycena chlorophos TaxID=658473 RepID=A0A8H6W053_MYCCL|nr:NACHT and ankyrin domain protein [Mycena chlorophos]
MVYTAGSVHIGGLKAVSAALAVLQLVSRVRADQEGQAKAQMSPFRHQSVFVDSQGVLSTDNISVNFPPAQNDDYHAILDFVSPINFLLRQQEIIETWHKNTGAWILEHPAFLEWKTGSTKLLWCTGIPGAGKTVLA